MGIDDKGTPAGFDTADTAFMQRALTLAERAAAGQEVPVGAVLVLAGDIVGEGWNRMIAGADPTAHAECVALRAAAAKTGNYRLPGSTLYVTLEPCTMCVGALLHARLQRLVFAAREPRAGAVCSRAALLDAPWLNHRVHWQEGLLAAAGSAQLQRFFRARR